MSNLSFTYIFEISEYQMTPLAIEENHYLSLVDQPACIFGCGIVTSFNENKHTFVIHGTQNLSAQQPTDDFVVCCCTDSNPISTDTCCDVPRPLTMIGFLGTIRTFCKYTFPKTLQMTHAIIVDVRHITSF